MRRRGLVVGLGSIGQRHLANFRLLCPGDEIAVLRHRGDDGLAQRLGADRVFTELEQAIEFSPHWSVIATPATLHEQAGRPLASAGSDVLIEKPIATKLEDARTLVEAAERGNRHLMVGYNLRFEASLRAAWQLVSAGRIGRVLGIHAAVGQYLPDWRPNQDYRTSVSARRELGGGALLELSHELDYVSWLAGEPLAVDWASVRRCGTLEIDVEDWVELQLRTPTGVTAAVHLDFLSRVPFRQCRVTGSEGSIVWDGIRCTTQWLKPSESEMVVEASEPDRNRSYIEMAKHFLDCVRTRSRPEVDGECGMRVLKLVEAARSIAGSASEEESSERTAA